MDIVSTKHKYSIDIAMIVLNSNIRKSYFTPLLPGHYCLLDNPLNSAPDFYQVSIRNS